MLETTICIPQAYFYADVTQTNSVAVVKIPIDKDTTIASCSEEHLLLTWNPISSVVRFYDGAANASHLEPYQFSCSYIRVYALVLEPYQFSCSYIRVYAWVLEPHQFSCSYIRVHAWVLEPYQFSCSYRRVYAFHRTCVTYANLVVRFIHGMESKSAQISTDQAR